MPGDQGRFKCHPTVTLTTNDSFSKVYAWYQARFGPATKTIPSAPGAKFSGLGIDHEEWTSVVIGSLDGETTVTISGDERIYGLHPCVIQLASPEPR
jgi:hypothetical protein